MVLEPMFYKPGRPTDQTNKTENRKGKPIRSSY